MKRILSIIIGLICTIPAVCQNTAGKADDLSRLVLTPYVVSNSDIPSYASSVLDNKLNQIVTKHGVGGTSADPRFVITANLMEISKDFTATAPPMIALTLSPTIYIGDAQTGELYASCQIKNVKGVGENETKAYLDAIKRISVNSPEMVQCINTGKTRIIEYYNSQIDFILAEAESLSQSQNYDEAMVKLAGVPQICKDAYLKAYEKIGQVFQKKIDTEGDKLYNEAFAQWNTAKNEASAQKVVELLAQINPLSAAAPKARTLVKAVEGHYSAIAARRREIEERNWQFKMQQYADQRADIVTEREYRQANIVAEREYRQENIVAERENKHEYDMKKLNFDYDVEMERARNGADAALFALQEVKGVINTMSTGQSNDGKTKSMIEKRVSAWLNQKNVQ